MYLGLGLGGLGFDYRERQYCKILPASIIIVYDLDLLVCNLFFEFVIRIAALKIQYSSTKFSIFSIIYQRKPGKSVLMKKTSKSPSFLLMENAKKKQKEGPPFSGLHASRKVVSHRLCPQVPLLVRAYSAPQSQSLFKNQLLKNKN